MKKKTTAIIPAAGIGRRINSDIKKQYLVIDGKPILVHTIEAIIQSNLIDKVIIVVTAGDQEYCREKVISPYNLEFNIELTEGGKTRQESVFNGLQIVQEDCEIVLIHDGVRPFVNTELIEELLIAADEFGAATAAVPVKDTIKIVDDDYFVVKTPSRKTLWATQTPQTFRYELIKKAHQKAKDISLTATDDASLVEKLGYKVKVVMGNYRNIKITTPEDLDWAVLLLKNKF